MAVYDTIADGFKKSTELLFRQHMDRYTYFNILGDIEGKSILDLACGEGIYSREFKQKGAARVVSVDISTGMIELAKQEEARAPLGIEYLLGDVAQLGKIGSFDLVVASYLLNHAETKQQLLQMCQSIFANLKPGGRFVSINNNLEQPPETYPKLVKYGIHKSVPGPLQEGMPITVTLTIPDSSESVSFDDYYLSEQTYEWAFREAGFQEIRWHRPSVSPEGVREFGHEFWQDGLDFPHLIGIECLK